LARTTSAQTPEFRLDFLNAVERLEKRWRSHRKGIAASMLRDTLDDLRHTLLEPEDFEESDGDDDRRRSARSLSVRRGHRLDYAEEP
jgi:hypothetical protein